MSNPKTLSSDAQSLLQALEQAPKAYLPPEPMIEVSRTVSAAAFLYEKARNAVEYREEHLIRRAAIERILKRRLMMNKEGKGIAEPLIRELLWARYLREVPKSKIGQIQAIIDKYAFLRNKVLEGKSKKEKNEISEWLWGVASCEIEKNLVPTPKVEAILAFMYRQLVPRVVFAEEKGKIKDLQVYIAVHRALIKSDEETLRYYLFTSYFPSWSKISVKEINPIAQNFDQIYKEIERQLNHPLADRLFRFVRKQTPPFLILRDLIEAREKDIRELFANPTELEEAIEQTCQRRYNETGERVRRAIVRSIIYIFLTKMLFGLVLELPFDLIISKKIQALPLAVNALFPPLLMAGIATTIKVPGRENTKKIINRIKSFIYQDKIAPKEQEKEVFRLKLPKRKPFLTTIFTIIYTLAFIVSFGALLWFLAFLKFNIASKAIFLFFLCVVSFFGYRIRRSAQEYLIEEKEGILRPLTDFFWLPILRVGNWLSAEIAKINIFLFIFDFVIEAPFKAIFEVVEEWVHFIRTKREEII